MTATDIVLLSAVVILLAWEAYTLVTPNPTDHITYRVRAATRKTALLPFLVGVLMGHFFWCGC